MALNSEMNKIFDKFWKGDSSLEEEDSLKNYFQSEAIEDDHLAFKEYFDFIAKEKSITLESEIQFKKEEFTKDKPQKTGKVVSMRRWISVAASVIILFGAFWLLRPDSELQEDTFENPELALQQAKDALFFLSAKLDKGSQSTADQLKQLEKLSIFN